MATDLVIGETVLLTAQAFVEHISGSGVAGKHSAVLSAATTWVTSNAALATVSTAGPSATCTVTGVAAGAVTITATCGALTAERAYLVVASPGGVDAFRLVG
jgi:uncharacterized protein YjdB